MLVYGERRRLADPSGTVDGVLARLPRLGEAAPGLPRHAALVEAFLDLGALVQGLADAEFERLGQDDDTPLQAAGMAALQSLARPLVASWRAGFGGALRLDPGPLQALRAEVPAEPVACKAPEGYAFYAVYPEAYAEAAADLVGPGPGPGTVIGLRSIGVSLAAVAAAALGAPSPVTLRPTGHPFQRELRLSRGLEARLEGAGEGLVVVVDEGPGLSGSSFGAVGDWLEGRGVPPARLAFMPSHRGGPGPMASPVHRARWARTRRAVREFDDLAAGGRLAGWVEDLTGPALEPLQDLSGGRWRALRHASPSAWPPVSAGQERRKFLLRTGRGAFLLKFAGLGRAGLQKAERGQGLAAAGFSPRPLGFRHGFLVEPWLDGAPLQDQLSRPDLIGRLARYLAFRAKAFPAGPEDGAGQAELQAMVSANAQEALGAAAARALERRFPAPGLPLRPVRTDGRLHRWEWLVRPDGRLLKTDALDHDDAHDLVGCQDLAWDVAGAEAEFDLAPGETQALLGALDRLGAPVRPDALAFMRLAYPAFQIGLWTFAEQACDAAEQARIAPLRQGYARRLEALAR